MSLPTPNFQPMPSNPRRCAKCFYVLENLTSDRCPECGRNFNFSDPLTYTTKQPFLRWKYWLPGFVLSIVSALAMYVIFVPIFHWQGATVIALPFSFAAMFGYGSRISRWFTMLLAIVGFGIVMLGLFKMELGGIFCLGVLAIVGLIPVLLGALLGLALRRSMKSSRFSQRDYLPILIFLLLPMVWAVIEGRHDHLPAVMVRTSQVIDAPPDKAWKAVTFYEEVKHTPPWLLRLPLWRPLYTTGHSEKPGDIKVCVYTIGELAKKITSVEPGKRLTFDVIQQKQIETEAVRLLDGSFEFEPIDGGKQTRVTLTTRYEPLLTPRFAWLPFEKWTVHTLHGHVLKGMALKADEQKAVR